MRNENDQIEILIDNGVFPRLLGVEDENLRFIAGHFKSVITARNDRIMANGPVAELEIIRRVFTDMEALYLARAGVSKSDIRTILRLSGAAEGEPDRDELASCPALQVIDTPHGGIFTRGAQQELYVRLIDRMSIVFAVGPAGTGKTYLAVAMAVNRFQRRIVDKIILVRPVVETGETLGFLPGDILEKVDPYFRPLYDALDDIISRDQVRRLMDKGLIEIAPLAYMRGRTLNNAFVILDEAQNTTSGQMKMFLTRLGVGSKALLTGDLTQIDLPNPAGSGLLEAYSLLQGIQGIGFVEFTEKDVVRHRLVVEILRAYEKNSDKKNGK
jgi:phosphate starvation-inducible PhoH-like protein